MPGTPQVTKTGPRSYTPADNELIVGGHLVEARKDGRIGLAAAGSLTVLGAAIGDASAPEGQVLAPVTVGGRPVLNAVIPATEVAVAYGGVEVKVEYAADAQFGDQLAAAAGGCVTPATGGAAVVARCTDPAGASAGQYRLTRVL